MRSRVRAALAGILGLLALAHVSIYRAVRESPPLLAPPLAPRGLEAAGRRRGASQRRPGPGGARGAAFAPSGAAVAGALGAEAAALRRRYANAFVTVLGTKGAPGDYAMAVESALRIPDAFRLARVYPHVFGAMRDLGVDAFMRVDDDVLFLGAVAYDPFQWMYEAGAVYVYGTAVREDHDVTERTLGAWVFEFCAGIDWGWTKVDCGALRDDVFGRMFFNNAAAGADAGPRRAPRAIVMATRTAFWFGAPRAPPLGDRPPGSIYVHRWGDAPIQTAAVRLFAPTTAHARLPVLSYVHLSGKDYVEYSTFSLWDTYRAQHPLLNLLHPRLARDVAESLLLKAEDAEHSTVESLPRSGYPGVIVLADAVLKNVTNFGRGARPDGVPERALRQMARRGRRAARQQRRRGSPRPRQGRVPRARGRRRRRVRVARRRAARRRAARGDLRARRAYAAYWGAATSAFQGRTAAGAVVRKRLDAYDATGHGGESLFEEGTPLQYSLMVPHDVPGLVALFGGAARLRARLERYFFNSTSDGGPDAPVDLETGYVGGHCHGNEPGHHAPYLFNAAGAQHRAQAALDRIAALYTARDDGLPGNDDVGQTSAWPLFADVSVDTGAGRTLRIVVRNAGLPYVRAAFWGETRLASTRVPVADVHGGGTLTFVLGLEPGDWTRY
ncbi:glycosyl hydrolase [Aureococcus anophagefferens]|nr:glycosyl hydrolase [Aureococcus anophagefferens]